MTFLIGADVGGSKTAVGVSEGGEVLVRTEGPGAAVRPGRALASAGMIAEVVRRALAGLGRLSGDLLLVGAAGAGRDPERSELAKALRAENLARHVVVTTDIELALAGAFESGPGIVVSAGTGSIAVGRDATGAHRRIGGYGWPMGDEGSGYAIGRAALGAVSRAQDGRSPHTALSDRVLSATRSADFDSLVRWAASASPSELAGLAPHVLEVAEQGDPLAQGIADYAARELSQLAICLLPLLRTEPPVGVALTGGLLAEDRALRRSVLARLGEDPALRPIDALVDAVVGALRLAAADGRGR
jgi:N-acetylglucosamine kinase-like BadF-type ATPase